MFQADFGIFDCKNIYDCLESLVLSAMSLATLVSFVRAYKIIKNDKAQILDKMDKIIFYLAFVYTGLLSFSFVIYTSPLFAYSIRMLYMIQNTVMCAVVGYIYLPEQEHPKVQKFMQAGLLWALLLWFFAVMDKHEIDPDKICSKTIILYFSGSDLLISLALGVFGYGSITLITQEESKRRDSETSSNGGESIWQVRKYQELAERKIQLSILTGAFCLASLTQFVWDLKIYNPQYTQLQCDRLTFAHSFFYLCALLAVKSFCYLVPSWGIFYVYYWRNKSKFRSEQDFDGNYSDFDELRSELVEMD